MVPALAVAAALRAEGAQVVFIGGERAEAELVPAAGYPLHTIGVEGLSRSNPLKALRALVRAGAAVVRVWALLGELRHAVEHDELRLYFQPKIDLRTARVAGAEVLLRWQHPTRGLLTPVDFIPFG